LSAGSIFGGDPVSRNESVEIWYKKGEKSQHIVYHVIDLIIAVGNWVPSHWTLWGTVENVVWY
jgi:hypothetical protein